MKIQTIDYRAPDAGHEFIKSLHETGFAVIRRHPLPRDLLDSIYVDWHAFFQSNKKFQYQFDPDTHDGSQHGYYPPSVSETAVGHDRKDLKEFYHLVPGGRNPPQLQNQIYVYRELAFSLGRELLSWIQKYAPHEVTADFAEPLPGMLCDEASLLRILHYPPLAGNEDDGAVRAAAHEDINLITLLPVSDQPGLQVKDNDGQWIDVSSIRGELVVNAGDMLQEATAGYFPSTTHRVVNPGGDITNESRLSIPFFLTPRLDIRLSDRYTSGSYLSERLELLTRET
jgi:isopenicillin N synthase-like dioxygenase